jgi:hypothetical protein
MSYNQTRAMMYALTTGGGGQRPGKDPAILPDLAQVRKTHTLLSLLFKVSNCKTLFPLKSSLSFLTRQTRDRIRKVDPKDRLF